MSSPTAEIAKWIDRNFDLEYVTITDFPLFPFGRMITDRDGDTMVVYWDILKGRVTYAYPDGDDTPIIPQV